MCGRAYSTYTDEELALRYENKKPVKIPKLKPNYNMAPSQEILILREKDGKAVFEHARWGLIPFWAKDEKIGYKMINSRAETLTEKPAFRNAFKKRRCIVPVSGFFEWKRTDDAKRPFKIALKNEPIMSVAGIWECWTNPKGQEIESVSIITTEANAFMNKIHDRMPVILAPEDEDKWLDTSNEKPESLLKLLKPCPGKLLEAVEISTLVNSPKNNREEVLEPLA